MKHGYSYLMLLNLTAYIIYVHTVSCSMLFYLISTFNNVFYLFTRSITVLLALCIGLLITAYSTYRSVRSLKISLNLVPNITSIHAHYDNRCKLQNACRPYTVYISCINVILMKAINIRQNISHKNALLPNTIVLHEVAFMYINFNGYVFYTALVKRLHVKVQCVCISRLVDQARRECRGIVLGAGASRQGLGRSVPLLGGWAHRGYRVCSVECALQADTNSIPLSILLIHS